MLGLRISPNFHPHFLPWISPSKSNQILPLQNPNFPSLSPSFRLNHYPRSKQSQINAQNGNGDKNPNFPWISPSKSNQILPLQNPNFPSLSPSFRLNHYPRSKQSQINAQNGNGDKNDGLPTEKGDDGKVKNGGAKLNIRWVDLLLDRDPDNLVAVGLTGLLTWASVQVLWQLFVISASILIAAVKYSIVAALLIFILITLL